MTPTLLDPKPLEAPMAASANRVAFYTLGCKTNQLESSALADTFRENGWQVVPFEESAALYVLNTCTVTERSDVESRRLIRRAKRQNPQARVAVTGCYAQVAPQEIAALTGVDFVIGNNYKASLYKILESYRTRNGFNVTEPVVLVEEFDKSRMVEGLSSSAGIDRTRGSLKIQDGCDYKCTYCIIWEARGPSRSVPMAELVRHVEAMAAEGFHEIGLTGINIGQYEDQGQDLADLLVTLCRVPGDFRLRLTSLDPLEVTDKLIDVLAQYNTWAGGKLCPHVHLSAQSAQDDVLKRMGRRHHVADMIHVCNSLAAKIPGLCIGSDLIVGFPGETDAQFEETYEVLARVPMHYLHVFSYSKRKGTPAADWADQLSEPTKKARAARLRALSEAKFLAYRQGFVGQTLQVIVETDGCQGMAENYLRVSLEEAQAPNQRVSIRL